MLRRDVTWTTVVFWALIGGLPLAADERYSFTDEPDTNWEESLVAQPGARSSTGETTPSPTRSSARNSYARLARAPNMFGDSFGNGGQFSEKPFVFFVPKGGGSIVACACGRGDVVDLPMVGGPVIKVAENNKPIPMDRVYLNYNGVQNALTVGQPVPRDANINRYTMGFEKKFADELWSVNVGMPFFNNQALNSDAFSVNSASIGNLAVFLKRLMYSDDAWAASAGLGISLPTGSNLALQTHQLNPISGRIDTQNMVIHNQAAHLVPYVGFLSMPSDTWFLQGFLSLDFANNGNQLDTPAGNIGTLTAQNLLHVDFTVGRWIYQNPEAYYLHGVAAVAELHYTSAIQNTDTFVLPTNPDVGPLVNGEFRNIANRTDILNLTAGVQFQIGTLSNLRVACVVPMRNQPNRQFDSEIQVSFNRFF